MANIKKEKENCQFTSIVVHSKVSQLISMYLYSYHKQYNALR